MSDKLIANLGFHLKSAQGTVAGFVAQLDTDPAYAFQWADNAMKASAKMQILKEALYSLEKGRSVDALRVSVTAEVLRRAKYPEMSTSVPANLMATYKTAAMSELLEMLDGE
jgi:hypothetical protein